jgi:hypothetical protein
MLYEEIRRKRRTSWPWIAGLMVLALVVWGVTALLAAPEDEQAVAVTSESDDSRPAAIPSPPNPVRVDRAGSIEDLMPLGEEDAGQEVRAEGEVVATGTTGFWMLTGSDVLRVDSERLVRKGQTVEVEGVLEVLADDERAERVASEVLPRDPRFESWTLVRTVRLVEQPQDGT